MKELTKEQIIERNALVDKLRELFSHTTTRWRKPRNSWTTSSTK